MWLSTRERTAMRAKQFVTIAVATMLLIGGAAAVGAASPVDQADDNATDADEGNVPETAEESDRGNGNAAGAPAGPADDANSVGPADGLPEQVPDHVSEIHETIESFLNGLTDSLGDSLAELLSDGEQETAGDDQPEAVADDVGPDA